MNTIYTVRLPFERLATSIIGPAGLSQKEDVLRALAEGRARVLVSPGH